MEVPAAVGHRLGRLSAIADVDADGIPEIVFGGTVLNNDGTIRWEGNVVGGEGRGDGAYGPISVTADLDLDGLPEIVAGRSAYRGDGQLYWNSPIPDGRCAVANFDQDMFPEIVVVANGNVYLLEHTGTIKWGPVNLPGTWQYHLGGVLTVADMDADGSPEIGVAITEHFAVLETDGSLKWTASAYDRSGTTGSSVFDFNGDGSCGSRLPRRAER